MHREQTRPTHKTLKIALFIICGLGLVLGVFLLNRRTNVSADAVDIAAAEAHYPNMTGSRIDSCTLCHTSSIPKLNSYGAAYKSAGRSAAALAAIDDNDTDGDGFTNGAEIVARTFPGDANNHPEMANAISPNNIMMQYPYPAPATPGGPTATVETYPYPAPATAVPPTATATRTALPPTATTVPPTATRTATATAVPPTATTVPPTATRTATATAVPPTTANTATSVPPTATSVPPTATNTSTAVPPSATFTATAVPPTSTTVPPTNTVMPYPPPATEAPTETLQPYPAPSTATATPPVVASSTATAAPAATNAPTQPPAATSTQTPTQIVVQGASATPKTTYPTSTKTVKPRITRTPDASRTPAPTNKPRITRTPGPKPTHVEEKRRPTRTPVPTGSGTLKCRPDNDHANGNSSSTDNFGRRIPCPTSDPNGTGGFGNNSSGREDFREAFDRFIQSFFNSLNNWFK